MAYVQRLMLQSVQRSRAAAPRMEIVKRLGSRLLTFAKSKPCLTSGLLFMGRYGMGDGLAQTFFSDGSGKSLDWRRSLTFATFGLITGLCTGVCYNRVYPWLIKQLRLHRHCSVLFETCLWIPFGYFTQFYATQQFIMFGGIDLAGTYKRWRANIFSDMKSFVKFWPCMLLIAYTLLPDHLLSAFICTVGIVWVMILSSKRGSVKEATDEKVTSVAPPQAVPIVSVDLGRIGESSKERRGRGDGLLREWVACFASLLLRVCSLFQMGLM